MAFFFSEYPQQDMWNHISFLCNNANCKKLLNGEIQSSRELIYENGPDLEKKSNQISMCLNQAREYFYTAEKVSISTSPLLYFYGMLSLAKALIVANKQDQYLETIKYHGLHSRTKDIDLKNYQEDPTQWVMEKEFAVTNAGVYKHLCEIFTNSSFEDDSVILFKDVLSICPELSNFFEKYYKEFSKVIYLYSYEKISYPFKLVLCFKETDENNIYARFPELKTDFQLDPELIHQQARKFTSINLTECPLYIEPYYSVLGGRFLVGNIDYIYYSDKKKKAIHQATADYLGIYILSNCVRYKQDLWGDVIQGKKSGVLGIIELYISIVKRRYPNFILNYLFNEKFQYGSPAYLG